MKKFLLSMGVAAMAFTASAADLYETFAGGPAKPTSGTTAESTFTSTATGVQYKQQGTYTATKTNGDPDYLMMAGAQKNPNAYIEFELPIDCASFIITTSASPAAASAIKIEGNGTVIEEQLSTGTKNTEITVTIPAALRDAGTVYTITANPTTSGKNTQVKAIKYVEVTAEPKLDAGEKSVAFAVPMNGTQTATVDIIAENISEDVTAVSDNSAFTVSMEKGADAWVATVTFNGSAEGTAEATLTFSAAGKSTTVAATGYTAAEAGTETDPLTTASVIAMNSVNVGPFYVTGFISDKCGSNAAGGVLQLTETITNSNIVLTDAEGNNAIGVALPTGDVRDNLNISANPGNVGKEVTVYGDLMNYFSAPGVKNISSYDLTGIEGVEADNEAAAVYYNLQGVRVAEPANGLYIKVTGNKAVTVIL